MDSALHFRADAQRFDALAFIAKTEKNGVVVFVLYERKRDKVMLVPVLSNAFLRAIIKYPVHYGSMNANSDVCLHGFCDVGNIQLGFLMSARGENILLHFQV